MSDTLVAPRPSELTDRALGSRELEARFFELAGRALQPRVLEEQLTGPRFARARFFAPVN